MNFDQGHDLSAGSNVVRRMGHLLENLPMSEGLHEEYFGTQQNRGHPRAGCQGASRRPLKPSEELNARITLEVRDAYATEKELLERGVTVSDPVTVYGNNPIGAFLDSEGNKLWFCSDSAKG